MQQNNCIDRKKEDEFARLVVEDFSFVCNKEREESICLMYLPLIPLLS